MLQHVIKVPLKGFPEEGFVGAEAHEILDRIIIGRTQPPHAIAEAFCDLLGQAQVPDAATKICISDFPCDELGKPHAREAGRSPRVICTKAKGRAFARPFFI